jgi:hypothetical protein
LERSEKSGNGGTPPTNLYEYQKKGIMKIAFRKRLILKGAILFVLDWQKQKGRPKKGKAGPWSRTPNGVFNEDNCIRK